ncbi:MAG TPA: hypothetical protein HPP80_03635 [Rhodospirillaceae bacterium]|nr:hypothetical protein [Rhodospirillaceae bacterium]
MTEDTAFQLSRVYAAGWVAGRKCDQDNELAIDQQIASLNPHQAPEPKQRWEQGFKEALVHFRNKPPRKQRGTTSRA